MFGGVPIRVTMPPRIEAKESGISVRAGLRLARWAACISMGMSNASAATLFIMLESAAETNAMSPTCFVKLRDESTSLLASMSMAPDRESPRLTISTKAMMMTAGWPNPEKTWSFGMTPARDAKTSAANAVTS